MLLAAGQVGDTTKGVLIPITVRDIPHHFNTEVHLSFSPVSGAGHRIWLKPSSVFQMLCLGKSRHSIHSFSIFFLAPLLSSLAEKSSRVWSCLCFAIQGLSTCPHDPRSCCHVVTIVRPDFSLKWIRSEAILKQDQESCDKTAFLNASFPSQLWWG